MGTTKRAWCAMALAFGMAAALPAALAAGPALPAEAFFTRAEFAGATMSPNGKFMAVKVGTGSERVKLAVIDLANNSVKVVASFSDLDVGDVYWINDQRLVYSSAHARVAHNKMRFSPGLWAVNRDGSGLRHLVDNVPESHSQGGPRILSMDHRLLPSFGKQDSEYIYVTRAITTGRDAERGIDRINLYKLNTLTGIASSIDRPANTMGYTLDTNGEPRLAVSRTGDTVAYHYRDKPEGAWRELVRFDAAKNEAAIWTPAGFAPDGSLYAIGRRTEDKVALYRVNLANGQFDGAPVVAMEDFDFRGSLVTGDKALLGIHYTSDAPATIWLDPAMKKVQDEVDAVLKSTVNTIEKPLRAETPYVIVQASSDVQPQVTMLYDTSKKSFTKLGEARPAIKAAAMASQEFVKATARDGLPIPAWLTIPNGSNRKNLPLFVMVHAGPWVEGPQWGWSGAGQFLASRGYAVLEPNYRGTLGFGDKHYRASFKQWGRAMQDDIADTVRWAIKEGIADPQRICIGGASYGGYSALMGLIRDPDLYKCGVNWAGMTDISLMYKDRWSGTVDTGEMWKDTDMNLMIGDESRDAAELKKISPIEQAARITRPLLMGYGTADFAVPTLHAHKLEEAVKKTNPNVELVVYPEESHFWILRPTQVDWWTRVEKFLNQHIGK